MNPNITAEIRQIKERLVGATITTAIRTDDGESFGFTVKPPGKPAINVWVDCDPEGNGPGHLNLE